MTHFEHVMNHFLLKLLNKSWVVIALFFIVTLVLLFTAGRLEFDNSVENFLAKDNEERLIYTQFKDEYGLSEYFIILIQGEDIFSKEGSDKINHLENSIKEGVPYIKSVETIVNARYTSTNGEDILISSLFESGGTYKDIKNRALNTPFYQNRLINKDGTVTAVLVRMQPYIKDSQNPGKFKLSLTDDGEWAMHQLRIVLNKEQNLFNERLLLGGSLASTLELSSLTKRDLFLFTVAALFLICVILFLVFRRLSAVILPILSLLSAVSITLSLMMLGHFPMMVSNSILPSFLLAVCVGDAVHLLQAFYSSLDHGISKKKSVANALRHSSPAMFFTTLTTSIGVSSFAMSDIASISTFGMFAAIGVWLAFINTVFLLPALIIVSPIKLRKHKAHRVARDTALATGVISLISDKKGSIIFIACFCLCGSLFYISHLNFSHDVLKWFPEDNPSRVATETIDERLTGTMQIELLVSTTDGESIALDQLVSIKHWLNSIKGRELYNVNIKSSTSLIELIEETNKALLDVDYYDLPTSQAMLAQQILLLNLDSAERINSLMQNDLRTMRISLSTSWDDAVVYTDFLDHLETDFNRAFSDKNLSLVMTGVGVIGNRVFNEMLLPVALSYLLAAVLITICMVSIVKDTRLALALVLPSILPIAMVLAVMHILHIPLDLFTLLIGSIALGLIVDDSIHFIYTYKREVKKQDNIEQALSVTIATTGRALFTTTIVLCAGFMIYTLSMLNNLQAFGLLTTLCIGLAFVADIFITPAAILLLFRDKRQQPR